MKRRLFLCAFLLPLFNTLSTAQIAYNSPATHNTPSVTSSIVKKEKRKVRKVTVRYQYVTNVPDSIAKKTAMASQKLMKLFAARLKKMPAIDSVYHLRTFTTYKSKVIGAPTQVLIDINCAVIHDKNPRKAPATHYNITYKADVNIYSIAYDSYTGKTKINYNESHWPGYMYNDKAPTQADLDNDISLAMEHILKNSIVLQ